jgi:hypothetical protein
MDKKRIVWDVNSNTLDTELSLFNYIDNFHRGQKKSSIVNALSNYYLPFALSSEGASTSQIRAAAIGATIELEARMKLIQKLFLESENSAHPRVGAESFQSVDIPHQEEEVDFSDPLGVVINW